MQLLSQSGADRLIQPSAIPSRRPNANRCDLPGRSVGNNVGSAAELYVSRERLGHRQQKKLLRLPVSAARLRGSNNDGANGGA